MSSLSLNRPHMVVELCWHYLSIMEIISRVHRFNDVLSILNANNSSALYVNYFDGDYTYCLTNRWEEDLFDPFGADADPDSPVVNGIDRFDFGRKFLAYCDVLSSSLHENKSKFMYPAVFYSRSEMLGWFLLNIFYLKKNSEYSSTGVVSSFIFKDEFIHPLIDLREKLIGSRVWAYGPARKYEAERGMWHVMAGDRSANQEILKSIDELLLSF